MPSGDSLPSDALTAKLAADQTLTGKNTFAGAVDFKNGPHISIRPFLAGGVYGTAENTAGINNAIAWCKSQGIETLLIEGLVCYSGQINLVLAGLRIRTTSSAWLTGAAELRYTGTATATAITAGSDGASLPQSTINVASTAGWPASGAVNVTTSTGMHVVNYTGLTSTTITGCTGGSGVMSIGGVVMPSAINATASRALIFEHIRLTYSNPLFTGYLLDLAGTIAAGSSGHKLHDVFLGSTSQGTIQSAVLWKLDKVHTVTFDHVMFTGCARLGDGQIGNQSFSNNVSIVNGCHVDGCAADGVTTWAITGPGQGWRIADLTAEPNPTTAKANLLNLPAGMQSASLLVEGGWIGDSTGGGTWYNWAGPGPISILGGFYRLDNSVTLLNLTGVTKGFMVKGVQLVAPAGTSATVVQGNGLAHDGWIGPNDYENISGGNIAAGMDAAFVTVVDDTGAVSLPPISGSTATFSGTVQGAQLQALASFPNLLNLDQAVLATAANYINNTNCTPTRDTATLIDGFNTLKMVAMAAGGMNCQGTDYVGGIVPGRRYGLFAKSLAETVARPVWLSLEFYDSSHTLLSSVNGPKTVNSTSAPVQMAALTAAAPAGAAFVRWVVRVDSIPGSTGEAHHFSEFMFAQGTPVAYSAPGATSAITVTPTGVTQSSGDLPMHAQGTGAVKVNMTNGDGTGGIHVGDGAGNEIFGVDATGVTGLVALQALVTKTGAYTALAGQLVMADTSGGAWTLTLPNAPRAGTTVGAAKTTSDTNGLTIVGQGGALIDGCPGLFLRKQNHTVILVFTGANWKIVPRSVPAGYDPAQNGLLGASVDPVLGGSSTLTSSFTRGVLTGFRVPLPYGAPSGISTVRFNIAALGAAGLTSGQNFMAVYDTSGTKLGVTADLTATWNNTGSVGLKAVALAAATAALNVGVEVWVVFLFNATNATDLPLLRCVGGNAGAANDGLTGAQLRAGTILTAQTSMPASFTPGSLASYTGPTSYVAVS